MLFKIAVKGAKLTVTAQGCCSVVFKVDQLGPFIVDIDAQGNNLFDNLDEQRSQNKKKAMLQIGIEPDFEFTKLY